VEGALLNVESGCIKRPCQKDTQDRADNCACPSGNYDRARSDFPSLPVGAPLFTPGGLLLLAREYGL
jgi:hypothetical protein